MSELSYGVVLDRPDSDRTYAWGPFASFDDAARFAEFVQAEIDPARVIPWQDAVALPGVRVLDPVAELLSWRASVALPHRSEADRLRDEIVEHRRTVEYFDAQSKRHKEQRDAARAELAAEQAKVHAVETVKCWVNEDRQRFVFAEDLAFALGYTPTATAAPTV